MRRTILVSVTLVVALAAVLTARSLRADPADDQYAVAAGLYYREDWELAAEEFKTFLDDYPRHPKHATAVFFFAETLLQLEKFQQAAVHFRRYLDASPNEKHVRPALFRAGEAAYLVSEHDQARRQLQRFLAKYPGDRLNAYVLAYLGNIALDDDDLDGAEDYYRRAIEDFPQGQLQDDCRVGLARIAEKRGDNERSGQLYLAVASKTKSRLADDARFHLGALQYSQGEFQDAIETFAAFESSLSKSEWRASARLGHGWALVKLGRSDEAATMFRSISGDPKVGVEARYWLGLVQKEKKEWGAAATTFVEAAQADPSHELIPALRFHAGDALLQAGDVESAEAQFELVMAAADDQEQWLDDAVRGRVQTASVAKDHQQVDRRAVGFLNRFPNSPLVADVRRMAARSLLERKLYARAIEMLAPMYDSGEDGAEDFEGRILLSLAHEGLGQRNEALEVLGPVLESASSTVLSDAQLTQASLLLAMEKYQEAIRPLELFLSAGPSGEGRVKGLGQLAICHARTGRIEEAKRLYAELRRDHGDHFLVAETTEQLAEAAYDAQDPAWAGELFGAMRTGATSDESVLRGLLGLGWSQYTSGRLEDAAATLGQLLAKDPPGTFAAEAAYLRGIVLQQLGEDTSALEMYERVVKRYPGTAQYVESLMAAALLHDNFGRYERAAAQYARLAGEYPEFHQIDKVIYNWAWVLSESGLTEEAARLFERLRADHRDSPYWAFATLPLARWAYEKKEYAEAESLVVELLGGELDPDIRDKVLYLSAQIAHARRRWNEAAGRYQVLVSDSPQSTLTSLAKFGIAEAAFRQNDFQAAAEQFDLLAGRFDDNDPALAAAVKLRLCQLACQEKNWDEAYRIAFEIKDQFPDFRDRYEVDYVIGRCRSADGDFLAAREAYQRVIDSAEGRKTETAAKAQLMIAESYYHQKDYQEALRAYLRLEILYAYPELQAAALLQAGKCRELLGEGTGAVKLYDKLLKEYPDTNWKEEATRRKSEAGRRATAKPGSRRKRKEQS
jgi:TolA-binding protein